MKMRLLLISLLVCFQGVQGQGQGQGQGNQYDPMDRDKDGWNDLWVGIFAYEGRSRGRDTDGDGVSDYKEMQRFTSPYHFDAELPPIMMQSLGGTGGPDDIELSFETIPGKLYVIQVSEDLEHWEEEVTDEGFFWAEEDVSTITVSPTEEREFFRLRQGVMRAGFDEHPLSEEPENSFATDAIDLEFDTPINFYGEVTDEVYINDNGGLSLVEGLVGEEAPSATNGGFGNYKKGIPLIAPFWSDVDIRGPFEPDRVVLNKIVYGGGLIDGHTAFGVSWIDVGYSWRQIDKTNSFQLIMIDRSDTGTGNFDLEFNYNQIQWDNGGLPGFSLGETVIHPITGDEYVRDMLQYFRAGIANAQLDSNEETGLIYNSRLSPFPGRYRFEFREGRAHQDIYVDSGTQIQAVSLANGTATVVMDGTVTNPNGGPAYGHWEVRHVTSGGDMDKVTFSDHTPTATVSFTVPGFYKLRLIGFDQEGEYYFAEDSRPFQGWPETLVGITVLQNP